MTRVACWVGLLLVPVAWCAAPPAAGPVRLTAEQQRQVDRLLQEAQQAGEEGRFEEAAAKSRQRVAMREKWQGPRHWETIDARLVAELWQRLTKVAAGDRPRVARASGLNAESLQLFRQGRFREAEAKAREALAIRREVLGEEHPDTAASYVNLAGYLQALGRPGEALPLAEKALAIRRKALGEEHPHTAQSYNNLAGCLQAVGQPGKALPLNEQALAICRKALGEEHPHTARCYSNLATCLEDAGQADRAVAFHERALAIRRKLLGESHPDTATSINNLASCLNATGRAAEALPLFERALAVYRDALGEGHPRAVTVLDNVARCRKDMGQAGRALPLLEKALTLRRESLGEDHPDTAASFAGLASCLQDMGLASRALPLNEKALAVWQKVLGDKHPRTAQGHNELASCLKAVGDPGKALPHFERALAVSRATLGEEDQRTAICYSNVAGCLKDTGQAARALPMYERALAIWRGALGGDHPLTAKGHNNLAHCLQSLGQADRALPHFERALAIYRAALGEGHPDTAGCCNNLAGCLFRLGRLPEGARLLQASLPSQEAARVLGGPTGFERAMTTGERPSPHALLALGLARLKQPANAFRHAEASLARGLLDDYARSDPADAARLDALAARLRRLDDRLLPLFGRAGRTDALERQRAGLNRQRQAVMALQARLASEASARQLASLADIQAALPVDAAYLFWLDFPPLGQHWGCVLRREGDPAWVALPGSGPEGAWTPEDLTLAQRCSEALSNPSTPTAQRQRLLDELRKQRLEPLRMHLDGTRHLLVVPFRDLNRVPLELLAPEHTVSAVPSGSVLARLRKKHRPLSADSLLAVGDPVFTPPAAKLPPPPEHGLLLAAVLPGGPAAQAGLRAGDVLLSFGKHKLQSIDDLKKALAAGPGRFRYWRDGAEAGTRELAADRLGVSIDPLPARQAVARWRDRNTSVALRGTSHAPLPATAHEVRSLAALVKDTTTLLGSDASEQALDRLREQKRLERFRILHFATHGQADEADPDNCRLILAQDRLPNPLQMAPGALHYTGELTVKKIRRDWTLDADLVVLSACDTGKGRFAGGEGLLGFAHAFLAAGARSVVLSRWKVDDSATALLMLRFYENLLGARKGTKLMGRAAALAEAKEWLRKLPRDEAERRVGALTGGLLRGSEVEVPPIVEGKRPKLPAGDRPFEHPFYWAAFLLVGDPD